MKNNLNPCQEKNSMPYIVKPGDTLNSIARRFGINLVGLLDLNPMLRLRTLTEGMSICIPSVPAKPTCINGAYYVVQEGDSFYNLSKKYNISLNMLLEANPEANPYDLKVGQELCIPNVPSNCPFGTLVTIKPGTRLSDILISYNLSINEIREINPDFNPNIIVPGNELCIPPGAYQECQDSNSTEYVVKAGESLGSISTKFNMTPSRLLIANPNYRPANFLIGGTKICVPNS
jgi:LysM repeat protein